MVNKSYDDRLEIWKEDIQIQKNLIDALDETFWKRVLDSDGNPKLSHDAMCRAEDIHESKRRLLVEELVAITNKPPTARKSRSKEHNRSSHPLRILY